MKKILTLGIALALLVSASFSADPLNKSQTDGKNKSVGIGLKAAGCTMFVGSMVLTLLDKETKNGHFHGYEITYRDHKTLYLIGDAVGVGLFSVGAVLYFGETKKLLVNAKVKKKEAAVHLTFSF